MMSAIVSHCLLLCLLIAISHGCRHDEAAKNLDLSLVKGTFVEVEITEDKPTTDCMEYTILFEPTDKAIMLHGHFYDIGTGKWDIIRVTLHQHPTDKTAFAPQQAWTDKMETSIKWHSVESAKVLKADGHHIVWSLCFNDGTDMILIFRAKNYTEDGTSLNALMQEYNKLPDVAKFHSIMNQKICDQL